MRPGDTRRHRRHRFWTGVGLLVLLAGCASAPPEIRVEQVPVPPRIEIPVLRDASGPDRVQALAEYIAELKARLAEAIAALEAYRR